ncbi:MAG: tRNA (adenosine(37)-N6)-threonylcarbamoyltransferase complex transferase subunit TsaD [Thermodesulfobacteriota bacterium]
MLVLGIESSCDDTGAAVVRDGTEMLSSVVASQDDIHGKYGGVVPELASRRHIEDIVPVVDEALERANVTMDDIDAVAVTQGPGLVGSILIGLSFAKAVSYAKEKPLVGVNHLEAHALSVFLKEKGEEKEVPEFPFVALVVSGGHTVLFLIEDFTRYKILGQTRDDAAGEAFDKVGKLLGLGYPGGVEIDRLAVEGGGGDVKAYPFTRPYIKKGNLEFSFSGIKTAVLAEVKKAGEGGLTESAVKDLAASFQEAVVDVLVRKVFWAVEATGAGSVALAGGVACNSRLRARLKEAAGEEGIKLFIPPHRLCSDNGAMIAALGYHLLKKGEYAGLDTNALPNWDEF